MHQDIQTLRRIYNRTNGRCHVFGKKLSLVNNLFPACIGCNLDKGTVSSRTARGWYGRKRAPLSKQRKDQAKRSGALAGGLVVGLLGGLLGGPRGALLGAAIGVAAGYSRNPD